MKEMKLENPENYEVLVTAANLPGHSRKTINVACYLPPNYPITRGREALEYIEEW